MTEQLVVPVILCGGAGTRLWPVSREKMPKQFVPLIGTSSTFQQVLDRVSGKGLFAPPMIVTNSEFRFVVAEQARSRNVKATIILEPQRRDSAAAIAAAAELAIKTDPAAILLVVADHLIANPGKIPLELIEVQVGSYLGEDDILRLEDVYRRHAEA
jgi:mannose-1-phosphate guanylyltransferase / mannose-6-phosphate isomerase